MLNAIFRPLEKWPGTMTPAAARKNSPFQSDYQRTLDLLEFELEKLGAKNITIYTQVDRAHIRNDGWLKAGAPFTGPAVLVQFTAGYPPTQYVYPCDTFTHWQANLRAIGLGLEALRKVDRYGITRRGEQYAGFRALPPPAEPARPKLTPEQAAAFLSDRVPGVAPSAIASNKALFESLFRMLQVQLHPDKAGGSHAQFVELQEAGAVLMEAFKKQEGQA